MPFTYGMGKGEASSVFYVLHHMKQVAIQAVLLETDRPSLGGDRAAFLHGGSIPLCQGQIFVTNLGQILLIICQVCVKTLSFFTHIWRKLKHK